MYLQREVIKQHQAWFASPIHMFLPYHHVMFSVSFLQEETERKLVPVCLVSGGSKSRHKPKIC